MTKKRSAEKTVRDIRRATRHHYSIEEKICIVLEGLRGEDSIAELCQQDGINSNVYYCKSSNQSGRHLSNLV
jgi:transposase